MERMRVLVLVVALAMVAAACGAEETAQEEEATAAATAEASTSEATSEEEHAEGEDEHAEAAHDGEEGHPEAPAGAEEVDEAQPRLVVADGEAGEVTLLDLTSGEPVDTYETAEPAYLSTSSDGRLVYLIQYDNDEVDVLDAGSWAVDHGDHQHHYTAEPTLLDALAGPAPSHVVGHDGTAALFTDGNGEVMLLDEDALTDGEVVSETIATGRPHHGVAIAVHDEVVVTLPNPDAPEGELPHGVTVRDEAGEVVAESADCPELHGEVSTAEGLAFACADGVLVVDPDGADSTFTKVAYPAEAAGLRAWSLVGGEDADVVFGALSGEDTQRAVTRLDLATGSVQQIALPADASAVALDSEHDALLVVTADGQVHLIDTGTGEVRVSEPVVGAFDYGAEAPRPQIAVGDDRAYVSDPAAGTVVEVATNDDLRVTRTLDVSGAPQRLTVVGAR